MSLIRRTPRVSQPQQSAGIDYLNPITRGLRIAVVGGMPIDLATQNPLTKVGALTTVSTRGGLALTNNASAGVYAELPAISGLTDLTVLWVGTRNASVTGVAPGKVAQAVHTVASGLEPNRWELNLGNGFGAALDVDKPRFAQIVGGSPTNLAMWIDGVSQASINPAPIELVNGRQYAIIASGNGMQSDSAVRMLGGSGVSSYAVDGSQVLCVIWTRVLLSAEIASISANPWQIFAPEPRRLFVPAAVGGGATTITCTVGAASAVGVSSLVNTALQASVAAAGAVGVTASVNRTLQTGVAASSATGVTALVSRTLQTSVAAAAATGVTAQLATTVSAGPGNAAAAGVNAVINTAGNTTIACSVGAASAVGVAALVNKTLQTTVGAAGAVGITTNINTSLLAGVGEASAVGVSFSSSAVIYIPALLQFTSPSRAQTFTSPSRLQSFTSPARSGP